MSDQPNAYQFEDSELRGFLFAYGIDSPQLSCPEKSLMNQPTIVAGLPLNDGLNVSLGSQILWPHSGQKIRTQPHDGLQLIFNAGVISTIQDGFKGFSLTEESKPGEYLVMVETGQPSPNRRLGKEPRAHGASPHVGNPRKLLSWQSSGKFGQTKTSPPYARKVLWKMKDGDQLRIRRVFNPEEILLIAGDGVLQLKGIPGLPLAVRRNTFADEAAA